MPAHRPRRTFATPFVVTLAAASLPACGNDPPIHPNPPAPNPPAPTTPVAEPTVDTASPPGAAPASAASPAGSSAAAPKPSWSVVQENGKCVAIRDAACPPNVNCNPPKPTAYACPPGVTNFPVKITQDDANTCTLSYTEFHHVDCPPTMRCNPPPPKRVTAKTACPQ